MKTQPLHHQTKYAAASAERRWFANFSEQGTGKSWMLINDIERLYSAQKINSVIILAPNGVQTNWKRRELPKHLEAPHYAFSMISGKPEANAKEIRKMIDIAHRTDKLFIVCANYEMLRTKSANMLMEFAHNTECLIIADESHRIKNYSSQQTKGAITLRSACAYARISTGTPLTRAPLDFYRQFDFLKRGALGFTSETVFRNAFAETLGWDDRDFLNMRIRNERIAADWIIKRDVNGLPIYKNIDKLAEIIAPHHFRALKSNCLDLPEKVFKVRYFELNAQQRKAYKELDARRRLIWDDKLIDIVTKLSAITKLQQITSGFVNVKIGENDEPKQYLFEKNERINTLLEILENVEGKALIFCKYITEIDAVCNALQKIGASFVAVHGGIDQKRREKNIDEFELGEARFFVAQESIIGVTLNAAGDVIHFSSSFFADKRMQAQDRAHRIGQTKTVIIHDIVALDTIDEKIASSNGLKESLLHQSLGDW